MSGLPTGDVAPDPLPQVQSPPRPPVLQPGSLLWRLLAQYNPFYLLSAACMLASCLALTNCLSWDDIPFGRLVGLIVTINVYEFALIALGLYLAARRGLKRDARILLALSAFFLVDVTFLNAEVFTRSLAVGAAINVALFLLAAVKMGAVLRVLRPRMAAWQFAFSLLQLAVLFALPGLFERATQLLPPGTTMPPAYFYTAWWAAGSLPAAYELIGRLMREREPSRRVSEAATPSAGVAPVRLYLVLPWLSIVLHLGILHYVHEVHFYAAFAAPLLLSLAVMLNRAKSKSSTRPASRDPLVVGRGVKLVVRRQEVTTLQILLPAAALLVSLDEPMALCADLALGGHLLYLTPLKLAVAGAYLTYVYCFLARQAAWFLAGGAAVVLVGTFGPTLEQTANGGRATARWVASAFGWMGRLVPTEASEWGVVGLVASFVFLIVGGAVSLRKPTAAVAAVEPVDGPPGESV